MSECAAPLVHQRLFAAERVWLIARRCIFLAAMIAVVSRSISAFALSRHSIVDLAQLSVDGGTQASYEKELETARKCVEQENATCTIAALDAIRDPAITQSPSYLDLKAQALSLQRKEAQALAVIGRAISSDRSDPHYLITQGRIQLRFGNVVDATESFLNAARLEPQSPEPLYFLGMSFFLLAENTQKPEDYSRAECHFRLALAVSPDYSRAEFMLGVIDAIQSKFDESRMHLQQALRLEPANPYYHLHYGILLNFEGKDLDALDEMKKSARLNPSYALTHYELGTVYQNLSDFKNAQSELERALVLNPNLSIAYYHLGTIYHRLGMIKESDAALKQFKLTKTLQENESLDPTASAVIAKESRDSRKTSKP